jgi:drug/metabolite transporter (DMT)-like permease
LTETTPAKKRRSVVLVIVFTVLSATAQVLMKSGANNLRVNATLPGILANVPLFAGLALYGIGAALMILALRHGQLSLLYPMISLSYVWVAILSVLIFHETMSPLKVGGILVIMAGVGILGKGSTA